MHPAAKEYSARGWVCMPLEGKNPRIPGWASLKKTPETPIWGMCRNLGIVTGAVSGLVVLDVDPKSGGMDSLFELEMEHGTIPGPRVRTGSGGVHIYFKHPGVKVANSVGKVGKGIDIRGDGGQVVAPPSTHPDTGQKYVWEKTGDPARIPAWLMEKLGVQNVDTCGQVQTKRNKPSRSASEWSKMVEEGVGSGQRNHAVASLTGYFLRHNLPEEVVEALVTLWNETRVNPPLDEIELLAVIRSISSREAKSGGSRG